jgi:hypothetical protein
MPIEIVANSSDWLPTDQERWSAFLETETGKRLLPTLAESAPQLEASGDVNKILIRSGEVRGFQMILRELVMMAHPSAKTVERISTEYPSLDDDAKWEDGQTLSPTPTPTPTASIPE